MMHREDIIYEDNHILIVNKHPGEIVQGDKTGDKPLIDIAKDYIKIRDKKPGNVFLGLVHRLDRPTGGLVILAKTSKALSRLNNMIKNRQITKTYLAIVKKKNFPLTGTLTHYLKKNHNQNKSYVVNKETLGAKKAVLHYKKIADTKTYSLLEIHLETGRHHQIRCQLAHEGMPIAGDLKYGYPRSNKDGSISLLAYRLEFLHPVRKETIVAKAPFPKNDLWKWFSEEIS